MKSNRSRFLPLLLVAALLCLLSVSAAAETAEPALRIVYPSEAESLIAPGRDFYVIGQGPKSALAAGGLKVELFRKGEATPVRSLTHKAGYAAKFDAATPALDSNYGGLEAAELCMPDLLYDPAVPGSERDSACKITVTENNFAALILGGKNDAGLSSQGSELTAGEYELVVTLADKTLKKPLTLGVSSIKLISRFSPDTHFENAIAFAQAQGWRSYLDPFPGYWSPGGVIYRGGVPMDSSPFLETLARWRFADALEYEAGVVNMIVYNISASSASQSVELAALQRTQRVDTDLYCWYYDLGEPTLTSRGVEYTGKLRSLAQGDKLQFTRAQFSAAPGEENRFLAYAASDDLLDLDLSDGVSAKAGQTVSLFGLAAPLQNTAAELTNDGKNAYTIKNLVSSVRYSFMRDDKEVVALEKPVLLEREYKAGSVKPSLYEFRHEFTLADALTPGRYTITVQALDSYGNEVPGGKETLALNIAAVPVSGVQ